MKISDDHQKFISGKSFHSGLIFPISSSGGRILKENALNSRFDLIEEYCQGVSVLHLGCADHIELIDKKRRNGTWLHERLTAIATRCIGIDTNKNAIDYIFNNVGMTNVIYADITKRIPREIRVAGPWDKVVLGEIIEHIGNPVSFLKSLKIGLNDIANELILTAPNALRWENYKKLRQGVECVNSDHRFWFTPYTLAKIVADAGFKPIEFHFASSFSMARPKGIRSFLHYWRLIRFPALRDTIILHAEF